MSIDDDVMLFKKFIYNLNVRKTINCKWCKKIFLTRSGASKHFKKVHAFQSTSYKVFPSLLSIPSVPPAVSVPSV